MKKNVISFIAIFFISSISFSQEKKVLKKAQDSLKTEVIEVITSYAPKVSDAFKIKNKPIIELSKSFNKKKLSYDIISVPVASSFIPQRGTLKSIDLGEKELILNNYFSAGFGNYISPFLELYMHKVSAFNSEYGANLKISGSFDNTVKNSRLRSTYYDVDFGIFYLQEQDSFNWKFGFDFKRNKNNWYGLPKNINYTDQTISFIEEEQTYKYYKVNGSLDFNNSYIKYVKLNLGYFNDFFESNEVNLDFDSLLSYPMGRFGYNLGDIYLKTTFNFLESNFVHGYNKSNFEERKNKFTYIGFNPFYKFNYNDFNLKIGAKAFYTSSIYSQYQFSLYPDLYLTYPIAIKYLKIYGGISGDMKINSFRLLANKNTFISPTLDILPTDEKYNFFVGLKGILKNDINYNVKAVYKNEKNKPLFALNKSKSNGISTATQKGYPFFGYEYGNSFEVLYDDINTLSFSGEISYDFDDKISFGLNGSYNNFFLKKELQAWNLPKLKGGFFADYKKHKWYSGLNIFYVGNRKGKQYNVSGFDTINLNGYIDVNANAGYHFNHLFSAFIKINNLTNNDYQIFTNFNTQGIRLIAGIIWKFDSIF